MKNYYRIFQCACLAIMAGTAGAAAPTAVDMEIVNGESAIYILYSDGVMQTVGKVISLGYPGSIKAVDFELTKTEKGYYILEEDGTVYPFGDAILYGSPSSTKKKFVDMELPPERAGYFLLREDGHIEAIGDAISYGELLLNNAADLELAPDELGYYVLYQDGTIAFFGTAVNRGFAQEGGAKAVDLEIVSDGYYVLYNNGIIHYFGQVDPLPSELPQSAKYVDMALTAQGYRTITADGDIQSYFRLDGQGQISWYAKAEKRVVQPLATSTPTQTPTATPTPTKTPKPGSSYFDLKIAGFSEQLLAKLPQGSAIPAAMNTGQASLAGGGTFLAASDSEELPARRILFFSANDFSNSNKTGAAFAELVSARGAAEIRGISFSKLGMIVTVKDDSSYSLILIAGPYESSTVQDFMMN
ncbi:MAG: hypothetical protein AB1656_14160 [Candidatus Omnitrophota bacterium]